MGRAGRLAAGRGLRRAHRARRLAAARVRVRACAARLNRRVAAAGDAARAGADPRRGVGDVGGALVQSRRKRRAEGDGRDRRAAPRHRAISDVLGAAVGEVRLRGDADGRHGAGRLADRAHDRPADLPPGADRRLREPERVDGGDSRRLVPRRAGLDDAGRRLLGRRRRRRPAALAARPLGGRPLDGLRMAR